MDPARGTLLGLGLVALAACGRTSVDTMQVEPARLPRPALIVIHDFAISPSQITLDSAVGSRVEQLLKGIPESQQRVEKGQEIARLLTKHLVDDVGKLGIPTVAAPAAAPASGTMLDIQGQIVTVDEGNRLRRTMIGLGAGASEVRNLVQVYETSPQGRRLVEDFYATALSSRKPGVGPMAGAGRAVTSAATSAIASSGVDMVAERSQTVEGDVTHAAREITKQLRKLFVDQGWISA